MLETTAARRRHPRFNPLFEAKSVLLSAGLGCAIFAVTLPVGEAASQEDPYLKCVDVKKSKRRLKCYDSVLQEQHPEMFQKIEKARKKEQAEEFGTPKPQAGGKDMEKLKELDVVIIEYAKNPYGKWLLVTDAGQIWKQVGDLHLSLRGKNIKGRIKRGLMGSFFFLLEGKKYGIKIKRVR